MGKNKKSERLLTEAELELMTVIWNLPQCTVRDVLDALPGKKPAYTSVATIMKILEAKGVLKSEKGEKTHSYKTLLSRDEYEKRALTHVAQKVFAGNPSSMVMRLLNEADLSEEELKAIRKVLDERTRP
jgi:predicted transcriptional regulator